MSEKNRIEANEYIALLNDQGQYSIWPTKRSIPMGWSNAGISGSQEACLSFIGSVWCDMSPSSLDVEQNARQPQYFKR